MEKPRTRACDICGRAVVPGTNLPGNLALYTSSGSYLVNDAHDVCVGKALGVLRESFPNLNVSEHPFQKTAPYINSVHVDRDTEFPPQQ